MGFLKMLRSNRVMAGVVSFAMVVTSFGIVPMAVSADTNEGPTVSIQIPDMMDGDDARGTVSYSILRGEAREVLVTAIDVSDFVPGQADQSGTVRYSYTLPDTMENDFALEAGDVVEFSVAPAEGWVFDTHRGVNVNNGQSFTLDNNLISLTVIEGNNDIEFGFEPVQQSGQNPGDNNQPPIDPDSSLSWNTVDQSESRIAAVEVKTGDGEWEPFTGLNLTEGQVASIRFRMADAPEGESYVIDEAGFEYFHRDDDRIRVEHNIGNTNLGDIEAELMSDDGYTFTFAPAENSANAGGASALDDQNSYLRLQFSTRIIFANTVNVRMFVQYTDQANEVTGEEIEFSVNGNHYGYTGKPTDLAYLHQNDNSAVVVLPESGSDNVAPSSYMLFDEIGIGKDSNVIEFFNENYETIYVISTDDAADGLSYDFSSATPYTGEDGHFVINLEAGLTDYAVLIRRHDDPQGNIGWRYTSVDPEDDDQYVDYGYVIIERVVRDDETILDCIATDAEGNIVTDELGRPSYGVDLLNTEDVFGSWDSTGAGGEIRLLKGDVVTIRLVPYYGYQVSSANLNGSVLTPNEDVSSFTFTVTGNLHLAGTFIEAQDEVVTEGAANVTDASIVDGQNATDTGNLRLTVEDNASYANADAAIDVAVNGESQTAEIVDTLDLTLENIVSQGIDNQYWETPITEFDESIAVVLSVDNIELKEGQSLAVVREHEGVLEVVDAEYNEEDGSLAIYTSRFSTYTVVVVNENAPLEGVVGFCERLYTCALNRESDVAGRDWWVDALRHGADGASAAQGFFFSEELINSGISDEEFVLRLYRTFMDREPDDSEMEYWMNEMNNNGMTRELAFGGFIHSTEWANVCLTYGILSGGMGVPSITVDPSDDVIAFATRLYTTCLGREADEAGLEWWANELANLRVTGSYAAQSYFFSDEFIDSDVGDREFVDRLYLTFMDRNAGDFEFDYWLEEMGKGMTREVVFSGFAGSEEFGNICAEFGIIR